MAEDSGEVLSPSTLVGLASAWRRLVAGKVYVDERGHDDNNVISNQLLISISIVNTAHVYASNCTWQLSELSLTVSHPTALFRGGLHRQFLLA